jgi:hypothetical protein
MRLHQVGDASSVRPALTRCQPDLAHPLRALSRTSLQRVLRQLAQQPTASRAASARLSVDRAEQIVGE